MPPRTSAQSFADFRTAAWSYLNSSPLDDPRADIRALYRIYRKYNPDGLPAKQALTGSPLDQAMVDLIANTGTREVKIQLGDRWPVMAKTVLSDIYSGRNTVPSRSAKALADTASAAYLHVYPARARARDNDWRIGVNVKPDEIAEAVADLCPIMDRYDHIDHVKFSAPGLAGKPDSVIVYMKKDSDYTAILHDVTDAIGAYDLQASFAPMWNEVAPGLAEAAEPPRKGGSFGSYRCIVVYIGYWILATDPDGGGRPKRDAFELWLDAALVSFGISPETPHVQSALEKPPFGDEENRVFFQMVALKKGKNADFYFPELANR